MSMARIRWQELPEAARAAVTEHTGTIHAITHASDGANSAIALRLATATGGYFVKGIPLGHPQARTQSREAEINPYLPTRCPRIRWRAQETGWDLLGFELISGRSANFSPGSPDIPRVVAALADLATIPAPDIPLKTAGQRWADFTDLPSSVFSGDHLLHTDMAPHNVLIDDEIAHLIDWAWPTRGPSWIDPAVWVIRLIDAGHTPAQAEGCATQLIAWDTAPQSTLDAFAHANAAMWREIADHAPGTTWKAGMANSAARWADYRAKRSPRPIG